ncbi:unnamed protein product [Effrenium voratum]|nr:unnamed protein product [Effrenium voratum]
MAWQKLHAGSGLQRAWVRRRSAALRCFVLHGARADRAHGPGRAFERERPGAEVGARHPGPRQQPGADQRGGGGAEGEASGAGDPGTYRLVLNTLTKRSAWREALATWDEMRWIGSELEEPDFVLAMKAFTRGDRWQEAVALFAELLGKEPMHLSEGRHREALAPDCRAYTTAIDACRRVGAWPQAVQLLADMENLTVTPDGPLLKPKPLDRSCDATEAEVVAYNAVMSACEKGRDLPAAERIMEEIQFWARQPSERARGRMPARHLLVLSCGCW